MNFSQADAMTSRHWRHWQNQAIEVGPSHFGSVAPSEKRKHIIRAFAEDELIPLMHANGYNVGCSNFRMAECVARLLYMRGQMNHQYINDSYEEEDINHYYHVIDTAQWMSIWHRWSWWEDLGTEDRSYIEDIRFCVWTLVDLENSHQTKLLDELLDVNEDDDNTNNRRDPYLIDLANGYFNSF